MPFSVKDLSEEHRKKVSKKKKASFRKPMLAKLTHDHFSDKDWIYERKLDGERCVAVKNKSKIKLYSRNHKSLNSQYPEIVEALSKQKTDRFVIDGEIVAFEGEQTSFSRLQARMQLKSVQKARKTGVAVYYYVFDIMQTGKHIVEKIPLFERKKVLNGTVSSGNKIRVIQYRREDGIKYYKKACKKGWEGVIAKLGGGPYLHKRSTDWLKFKCVNEQELVIGGYTDPKGSRVGFGGLLLGFYKKGKLHYAGKVGTGFDDKTLKKLKKKLKDIETKKKPFKDSKIPKKGVNWVKPKLVAQIGFTEWTSDDRLRHPRFLGLRHDKSPKKVKKEG